MPTLWILDGWKITMYPSEIEEPHFHVVKAGMEYRYRLRDHAQMHTDKYPAPAGLSRAVRRWAERNRDALNHAWQSLQDGLPPARNEFRD